MSFISPFKTGGCTDRFIPSRAALDTSLELIGRLELSDEAIKSPHSGMETEVLSQDSLINSPLQKAKYEESEERGLYTALLQNQVLGIKDPQVFGGRRKYTSSGQSSRENTPEKPYTFHKKRDGMIKYRPERRNSSPFRNSPVRGFSAEDLVVPTQPTRKIAKFPYKILDAPSLRDDFYCNLLDWSSQNHLAVALGSALYLYLPVSSKVFKLFELHSDLISSVAFLKQSSLLAVGTELGFVQIWDVHKYKLVRSYAGAHELRVGSLSWCSHTLASGSKDTEIHLRDLRSSKSLYSKLIGHRQEVCGLKWSPDEKCLASGGNDNRLLVWSSSNPFLPLHRLLAHKAAVKAITWSPHQNGILVSGGGTADCTIKSWNMLTGSLVSSTNVHSQVCNIEFSKNTNEIVSTHGYSKNFRNSVIVWRYPEMKRIAELSGHIARVLYLSISPDGKTVVTGAGDETLRFWDIFPGSENSTPFGESSRLSLMDLR